MTSRTEPGFWKDYRKLPRKIREAARAAHRQFCADTAHPSLRFHRLVIDPRLWSVRVTDNYRAVGFVRGATITWFWIGDHKAFDRTFPR
jgi:hypothetical protein